MPVAINAFPFYCSLGCLGKWQHTQQLLFAINKENRIQWKNGDNLL